MNRITRTSTALALCLFSQGVGHVPAQVASIANPPKMAVAAPETISLVGITTGSTPFLGQVHLSTSSPGTLKSVSFSIAPKLGSVTRPVSAVYLADYLESRGYFAPTADTITVPIFGLYSGYPNTVTVTARFTDDTTQTETVTIKTVGFIDDFGYNAPEVLLPRTSNTSLSYDFVLLKAHLGVQAPIILDTDGEVRWVGTNDDSYFSTIFFDNSFFVAATPPGVTNTFPPAVTTHTGVTRMELDGTYQFLADYRPNGVTDSDHHNYDAGKEGFLVPVNTTKDTECVIFEVDTTGKILNFWNLADIISAAMYAGGDDPTDFVMESKDWFHNNANTYRKSDDTLIVSSRENFVIGLDWSTGTIKWILGDPTKAWYQYPSLRQYALTVPAGGVPPIGEHAVSITHDDDLLLFDNGFHSTTQMPEGASRTYSAPRKYQLDLVARTATEVWNYEQNQTVYSPITSAVYEDDPSNYMVLYANEYYNGAAAFEELLGLDSTGAKVFDYRYPATSPAFSWNATIIHIENLIFTGPTSTLAAGHSKFFTGEVALTDGVYYLQFPANGNVFGYYSYLSDPSYIYHFDLGYEYVFDTYDAERGVYLYDFASKDVFYTSPQLPFPYLYDFNLKTVLYYIFDPANPGTSAPRTFYDFSTGEYITK